MTDLLPLVKNLKDYVTHLAKSAKEERQALDVIHETYSQDPGMRIRCQNLRNRSTRLSGEIQGLYGILAELNFILALAEETQEEEDEDEKEERQNES